jgi:predicted ATPase/class 3 adenylate cyclase
MLCFKCGADNREMARFCDSCGTALNNVGAGSAAQSTHSVAAVGERRHLTVLFCDLVNSTSIASQLDPEEWRELVAGYYRVATAAIERFGGYVAQYLGDGVMAYFGWPEAHENDAERAARAGLAIVDEIAKLNRQLAHAKLSARVGIDSSAVVVGAGTGKDAHIFGDVPNIAARAQVAAEPDTVLATAATQRLISGMFVVEDRGPQSIKGIERPLQLCRIVEPSGVRGRLEAVAAARGLTKLVGREEELRLLLSRWERVLEGEGQAVLITGEPGIGKSRLARHFYEQIAGTPHGWAYATASPFFQNTPFHPVADVIRGLQQSYGNQLGRASEIVAEQRSRTRTRQTGAGGPNGLSTNAVLREKENQSGRLESVSNLKLDTPPIAQLFLAAPVEDRGSPLPSAEQRRRLLSSTVEWILGAAHVMPLAIEIEDLHWADPSTLELIELLTEQCAKAPLLLLYTARPGFHPSWQSSANLVQITLNPLNAYSARAIVEQVARHKTLPAETIKAVVERTDGVPLFVEELTLAVLENDAALLSDREIPVTLRDSLMARLDRLGPARETLQLGAVLGIEFPYDLLLAVSPLNEDQLRRHLRALIEAELLYAHGLPSESSYQFKHVLIRDVAYEGLLKSRRRELHTRIAHTLEEKFPERAAARPEILAYHYTEAGLNAQAVRYWRKAGQKASRRSANVEAITHLRKGLELIKGLPTSTERLMEEVRLQIALTNPFIATTGYTAPEVQEAGNRALDLCRQLGDSSGLFASLRILQTIYFNRGELEIAVELAWQLIHLAEMTRDQEALLWAHYVLGFTLAAQGKLKAAREHLERSIAFYDTRRAGAYGYVQDPGPTAVALLSHVIHSLGYPEQALRRMRYALAQARSISHPFTLAWVLGFAAELHWRRGEKFIAQELWNEEANLCIQQGFRQLLASASLWLGFSMVEEERGEDGMTKMRQALHELNPIRKLYESPPLVALAQGKMGEAERGLATIDEALSMTRIKTSDSAVDCYLAKGLLLMMKNGRSFRRAKQSFSQAIKIARDQNAKSDELTAVVHLVKLLVQEGRRDQAHSMLAEIYNWFTEGFDTADLKEAKVLLDELAA